MQNDRHDSDVGRLDSFWLKTSPRPIRADVTQDAEQDGSEKVGRLGSPPAKFFDFGGGENLSSSDLKVST